MATAALLSPASARRRHKHDLEDDLLSDPGIDVEEEEDEGLENISSSNKYCPVNNKLTIPTPRMDTYRFSMANMEDSQDVELDAILGELCALENQFDREIVHKSHSITQVLNSNNNAWKSPRTSTGSITPSQNYPSSIISKSNGQHLEIQPSQKFISHSRSSSGGSRPKFEIGGLQVDMDADEFLRVQKTEFGLRTDSPDNDSAFSDNVSMLSSESSASSGGVPRVDTSSHSMSSQSSSMSLASSPTQAEQAARIKAEKIKIALEKMREASIKKLFIKAFSADNSAKSLLVDERMTVAHVCRLLAEKNHVPMDTKWAIVEHIPELYMERVYEDHENLVENLLLWTRDSCNQILFLEREDKYDLFFNPEEYLLGGTSSEKDLELDDDAKATLLDEFFSSSGVGVPEVEGPLYLKSDGKKAWKKHFFVLRASGLYYCPKGKSKLSKDLLCLTTFEMNNVYLGFGWRKKYKSPTDFGFAIKHPQIQTKSSKYIKYLCAEDERSLHQWVMGIRIAKYGFQLKENYDNLLRDIVEEDLDTLAHARSFSICSMAKTLMVSSDSSGSPTSPKEANSGTEAMSPLETESYQFTSETNGAPNTQSTLERLNTGRVISRRDSIKSSKSNASSSSGCLSERSSAGTPTTDQIAFEADFPMGTIKRKPSMTPKIPLTNTTRSIAKQSGEDGNILDSVSISSGSSGSGGGSLSGSLGRAAGGRFSLRRSQTDDRISFGSLTKKTAKQSFGESEAPLLHQMQKENQELPLPPPPPEIRASMESVIIDTLPPPPPEAFRSSTLSLDTLPPPPPPLELDEDTSWPSTSSLNSLPPPPSPLVQTPVHREATHSSSSTSPESPITPTNSGKVKSSPAIPPKPRKGVQRRQSESDAFSRSTPSRLVEHQMESIVIKPKPSKHKLNLDLSSVNCCNIVSHDCSQHSTPCTPPCIQADGISPKLSRNRRTSAPCEVSGQLQIHPITSPTTPTPTSPKPSAANRKSRSQYKPAPPKRSENTKLSSAFTAPQRRSSSASAAPHDQGMCPPESFLRDLQRVMVRKWKVAQQLSTDVTGTPHQILGFRDPNHLPTVNQDYRSPRSPSSPPPLPNHTEKSALRSVSQSRPSQLSKLHAESKTVLTPKKRPPPPPPKRSDGTNVSRW